MAWRPSDTQRGLFYKKRIEELRKVYRKAQLELSSKLSSIDLSSFQYRTEQLPGPGERDNRRARPAVLQLGATQHQNTATGKGSLIAPSTCVA